MDGGPREPGAKSTYLDFAALQHRKALAHHRHAAFVKVAKRAWCRFAGNAVVNYFSRVAPLLHRHLRDARQRFAVLIEGRRVPNHENLGVPWYRQIILYSHSPGAVCLHSQPLTSGRGSHTGSPDYGLARDSFACHDDALCVYLIDAMSQPDFDAQLLEPPLCCFGEVLRKWRQDSGSAVQQDNSSGR